MARKKPARKKSASKKKTTTRKKVVDRKKPVAKKAAPKKKAAARKPIARKKASPKKSQPKKSASKKSASKTKSARPAGSASSAGSPNPIAFSSRRGLGPESGGQSGDTQGLSRRENVDSESVEELMEEGQYMEAEAVSGVENAPDADESEVHTREVLEDDVPEEYTDRDE